MAYANPAFEGARVEADVAEARDEELMDCLLERAERDFTGRDAVGGEHVVLGEVDAAPLAEVAHGERDEPLRQLAAELLVEGVEVRPPEPRVVDFVGEELAQDGARERRACSPIRRVEVRAREGLVERALTDDEERAGR